MQRRMNGNEVRTSLTDLFSPTVLKSVFCVFGVKITCGKKITACSRHYFSRAMPATNIFVWIGMRVF